MTNHTHYHQAFIIFTPGCGPINDVHPLTFPRGYLLSGLLLLLFHLFAFSHSSQIGLAVIIFLRLPAPLSSTFSISHQTSSSLSSTRLTWFLSLPRSSCCKLLFQFWFSSFFPGRLDLKIRIYTSVDSGKKQKIEGLPQMNDVTSNIVEWDQARCDKIIKKCVFFMYSGAPLEHPR